MPTLGPINTPARAARDTRMPAFTSALPPTDCTTKAKERSATTKAVDFISAKSARKPLGTLQEPSINVPQPMAKVVHAEFVSIESVRKPLGILQPGRVPGIDITERAATKEAQRNAFVSLYDAARFYKKEGTQTKQFREAVSQCLSRGYTVPAIARHIREFAYGNNLLVPGEKLYKRVNRSVRYVQERKRMYPDGTARRNQAPTGSPAKTPESSLDKENKTPNDDSEDLTDDEVEPILVTVLAEAIKNVKPHKKKSKPNKSSTSPKSGDLNIDRTSQQKAEAVPAIGSAVMMARKVEWVEKEILRMSVVLERGMEAVGGSNDQMQVYAAKRRIMVINEHTDMARECFRRCLSQDSEMNLSEIIIVFDLFIGQIMRL